MVNAPAALSPPLQGFAVGALMNTQSIIKLLKTPMFIPFVLSIID